MYVNTSYCIGQLIYYPYIDNLSLLLSNLKSDHTSILHLAGGDEPASNIRILFITILVLFSILREGRKRYSLGPQFSSAGFTTSAGRIYKRAPGRCSRNYDNL